MKRKVYKRYSRAISSLTRHCKKQNMPEAARQHEASAQREATMQASVNTETWKELASRALADTVTRPRPQPVTPCTPQQLQPLLNHLSAKRPVLEETPFTKGTGQVYLAAFGCCVQPRRLTGTNVPFFFHQCAFY